MAERHVSMAELAGYLHDWIGPGRAHAVERHVLDCRRCGQRLQRQARVEAALFEVAATRNGRPFWSAGRQRVAQLAVAAAVLFIWCGGTAPDEPRTGATEPASLVPTPEAAPGPGLCVAEGREAVCEPPVRALASMTDEGHRGPAEGPGAASLCSTSDATTVEPAAAAMCGPWPASFSVAGSPEPLTG